MEVTNYNELVDVRASMGIVKDYIRPVGSAQTQSPPQDYEILLDMARNDPILWTAIELTVDMVTSNGFDFFAKEDNDKLLEDAREMFYETLDFDQVLKNLLWQFLLYGDAYMEIIKENGKITELHPLETIEMNIRFDKHGEIEKYVQIPNGTRDEKQFVNFEPDKIIHFRLHWIGSQVYSYNPFNPLIKSFNTKLFANDFLQGLFRNLHPKIIYFLKNANRQQRSDFIENIRQAKTNPAIDIVGSGEAEANLLQYTFDGGLLGILEYLRTEVLMITRVPKMWLGISDGANRSSAEAALIPFETRIKKIHKEIASVLNRELMESLGFKELEFKFNPISLMDEKAIFTNAQTLMGLNIQTEKVHPVITYLKNKGVQLPNDAKIEKPTEMPKDSFPSRQRENKLTDKITSEVERKGVSEAGGEKLEQAKMAVKV